MNKPMLRAEMKSRISALNEKTSKSFTITEKAISLARISNTVSVAVFISTELEPDTSFLIKELLKKYSVFAPKITDEGMKFYKLSQDTVFTKNKYGIYEPSDGEEQEDFSIIFVPLVAFDSNCNRLGHGGGYYDRFLTNKSALKVGLAFSCQEVDALYCEEHDVPLDMVLHD